MASALTAAAAAAGGETPAFGAPSYSVGGAVRMCFSDIIHLVRARFLFFVLYFIPVPNVFIFILFYFVFLFFVLFFFFTYLINNFVAFNAAC